MKKLIRLSIDAISRHLGMSALILLQIIFILAGANVLLASYQEQYLLEKPFAQWLSSDGYYMTALEETDPFAEEEKTLWDSLYGDWERISFYSETTFIVENYPLHVIIYDNNFWDKYEPVMKYGKWYKSSKSKKKPWCVATSNVFSNSISLPGASNDLEVSGVLGDLCYIPMLTSWSLEGSIADNFYKRFDTKREEEIYLLMPKSQWESLGFHYDELYGNQGIIIPKTSLTDEEKQKNEELFQQFAYPEIPMSKLYERSKSDLNSRLRRFLPLLIAQFIITVFGMISASAVQTLQDNYIAAVYGICGMSRRKRLIIDLSKYGILLSIGGAITFLAYVITKLTGLHSKYGLHFTATNIVMSVVLLVILLICSVLSPFIITRKKYLADSLRKESL